MTSNTPVTQALLPCPNPWCNSRKTTDCEIRAAESPILMPSPSGTNWAVACPVCPIQTPYFDTQAEAVGAWNTRHTPVAEPWPGCHADLHRRRVTALAKLGLMLSVMAGGEAGEVEGFDAAQLYAEVLMALAIEDADDTDIALEIARDHPEGDILASLSTPTAEPMEMLVDQAWLDRRQDEPDAHVEAGYFSHPHIAEPARRIIERVADAVTTMQRESTAAGHEMAETIAKECIPHFEKLGMSNEGDGWGFDEDLFGHDDLDRLFRLRWDADQRATKRWQAGDELPHCGELRPLLGEVLDLLREAEDGAAFALAERLSAELEETKPGNRDAIWPDHADMVVWLLGELDHLTALTTPPTPDRIGKDAVREALAAIKVKATCAGEEAAVVMLEIEQIARRALSATPAQEGVQ